VVGGLVGGIDGYTSQADAVAGGELASAKAVSANTIMPTDAIIAVTIDPVLGRNNFIHSP
jgi:hypothetical protein